MNLKSSISVYKIEKYPSVKILALKEELQTLAKYLDILSISNLLANVSIKKDGKYIKLQGEINANITQSCAVSGTEIVSELALSFTRKFISEYKKKDSKNNKIIIEKDIDILLNDEEVDMLQGQELSFYAIIAEELLLEIDPYKKQTETNSLITFEI